MKQFATLLFLLMLRLCFANMASPFRHGTYASNAFSSRNIDIVEEKIRIKTDKNFKTASYVVEYFIKTDTAGNQIPLVFLAKDYLGDFKVWVDGYETELKDIPVIYSDSTNNPFSAFGNFFELRWNEGQSNNYRLSELKYFETNLNKGTHKIRVEYTGSVWVDLSDWVKEYSFVYSLFPAKNWKSFGNLEITIDAGNYQKLITTNLGQHLPGNSETNLFWKFNKLPEDYIEIKYKPELNPLPKRLMDIEPEGLTLIMGLLITLLHVISIRQFRKNNTTKKSWVLITGSIINPLIILLFYMLAFNIIDSAIGEHASEYHGYVFLIFILYPFFMPLYWVTMWLADRWFKKRFTKEVKI